ncbi:MAG: HEPN domain-containing protein [Planctomycetota bacterium]|nr:MAG: HEPN domain-containing protein [Planctomycetota bacterium]
MRKDTQNWIKTAEYDLETAEDIFKIGRYPYVIFMCHLAIEKLLKAHVTEVTQSEPAKTHNLVYLVQKAGLDVPQDTMDFLGDLSNGSVPTRYPDDFDKFVGEYTKKEAEEYLRLTKEAFQWLRQHQNLKE